MPGFPSPRVPVLAFFLFIASPHQPASKATRKRRLRHCGGGEGGGGERGRSTERLLFASFVIPLIFLPAFTSGTFFFHCSASFVRSEEPRNCYAPRSSAPSASVARTQPDAADGALFLLPIFPPSRRAHRALSLPDRASSFFPPPPSFSLSPSRVPELSVVSTFKEGWRRERSRLGLRQIFLFFFSPLPLPRSRSLSLTLSLSPSLSLSRLLLSSRILFSRPLFIPRISPRAPEWLNTKIIEPGVARDRARLPSSSSSLLPPLNRKNAKKDKQVAVTKE